MEFMLGCNYWDSAHGTDMWRYFDANVIENDVKILSENGVRYMRVFPNWRDFQPIYKLYSHGSVERDYFDCNEEPLQNCNGIDPVQINNFRIFADICDRYEIKLCVSIVTGWMSGRFFFPTALEGKNPISDPEVLMWTARYIKGFVEGVKDCKNIVMWDLGNECNALGPAKTYYEAYTWTVFVRNAIRAADSTRPISSGMHSLYTDEKTSWQIKHQGEINDYLCTHPYVSKTINNDIEPMNRLRTTLLPTIQCEFYSDLSGKPVILQEQGALGQSLANAEMNADFARVNILSSFIHGFKGYFWWCGTSHFNLKSAPYIWSMIERDLGMIDSNKKARPVAKVLKETGERIKNLPFEELPEREIDAVCLLTREQNHWNNGSASAVLAKQAGFEVKFSYSDYVLPKANIYLVPSVFGWEVMHQNIYDKLIENVYNGATAYISFDGGQLCRFEEFTGLRSLGSVKTNKTHIAKFPFGDIEYSCTSEILLESIGAEILAVNEENNIVFSKYQYGKGTVYFLNIPLEQTLSTKYDAYNNTDYYKIYDIVAKPYLASKPISCNNPSLGMTLHKLNENKYLVCIVNYSDVEQEYSLQIEDGWILTAINDSGNIINKCDAGFYYLDNKKGVK